MSSVRLPTYIPLLVNAYDVELVDFFDGYDYRSDLLELIDVHVADLVGQYNRGVPLGLSQYKILQFVVYGNPVDAYKYFEYNYQTEWLAHR